MKKDDLSIFLVGGAVRDLLLGKTPKDLDYVVLNSTEEELLNLGYLKISKNFPVFSHPDHPESQYCLARTELKTGSGYNGFSVNTEDVSLYEDLKRRDFTINSMAMGSDNVIIDHFKGQEDLTNKVIRHVGDHFVEDPLRMIRASRFSARLNFTIDDSTKKKIREMLDLKLFNEIHPFRIQLEFQKAIKEGYGCKFVLSLIDTGVFDYIFNGYDLALIKKQTLFLDNVFNEKKFYSILFFGQAPVRLKQKDLFSSINIDYSSIIIVVNKLKKLILDYDNISTSDKLNVIYFSSLKHFSVLVFVLNLFYKQKLILKDQYHQIISDWRKVKAIDFSYMDNVPNQDKKTLVIQKLISVLEE